MRSLSLILLLLSTHLVFSQKNLQLLDFLSFPVPVNDIWGITDSSGTEYALVCTEVGVSIVQISNPDTVKLLFNIPGAESPWRDIKSYAGFAYAVNEESNGLQIIDCRFLPDSIHVENRTQFGAFNLQTAHNIFIDENGIAYIVGSNIANQGAFMLDLNTSNRFAPVFAGLYDDTYVHDVYARGDTLYTAELNNGTFSVVDISNKISPIIIARKQTTSAFTHNVWLSNDGNYLITTDEKPNAFVELYDISNLNNIKLLDKYQSSPGDSVIPHNTHFKDDYILTSYYRDGVRLVDATLKNNLVEIGYYDTSPFNAAEGFEGNWGVYPYFESGKIIASDRQEGLFVLEANYTRAAYLNGTVFDTLNNLPLSQAKIALIGTDYIKESAFNGSYHIGAADSGFYDIRVTKPGCATVIKTNIKLETGIEKVLNLETSCQTSTSIRSSLAEVEISIYFSGENELQVNYKGTETINSLTIQNALGQKVKQVHVADHNFKLNIDIPLPSGIFFIYFESDKQLFTKKIIK